MGVFNKNNKYKSQIHGLIKVNNTHIQKQENEILKLTGNKNELLKNLNKKDREISKLVAEKTDFKINYFKTIKSFGTVQINFFRNHLSIFEAKVADMRTQKDKIQKDVDTVEAQILKHKAELKKYSFKNEKS